MSLLTWRWQSAGGVYIWINQGYSSANPLCRIFCAGFGHVEDLLAIIASPPCTNYLLGKFTLVFFTHLRARLRASRQASAVSAKARARVSGSRLLGREGSDPLGSRAVRASGCRAAGWRARRGVGRVRRGSRARAVRQCVLESSVTRGRVQRGLARDPQPNRS